jgi:hypothetical protein
MKMRKLIYMTSMSLDRYTEPARGDSRWAMPDEELHGLKYVHESSSPSRGGDAL